MSSNLGSNNGRSRSHSKTPIPASKSKTPSGKTSRVNVTSSSRNNTKSASRVKGPSESYASIHGFYDYAKAPSTTRSRVQSVSRSRTSVSRSRTSASRTRRSISRSRGSTSCSRPPSVYRFKLETRLSQASNKGKESYSESEFEDDHDAPYVLGVLPKSHDGTCPPKAWTLNDFGEFVLYFVIILLLFAVVSIGIPWMIVEMLNRFPLL